MTTGSGSDPRRRTRRAAPTFHPVYLVFLVPFIALLWPALYSSYEPEWIGVPFFYWYQFLWLVLTALLTALVYVATRGGTDA